MEQILVAVERASLVRISCRAKSLRLLRESIEAAEQLARVGMRDVKPLVSLTREHPWNRGSAFTRSRDASEPQEKACVLANASRLLEDYYVTPPPKSS